MSGRALEKEEEHIIGHLKWTQTRDLGKPSSHQPFFISHSCFVRQVKSLSIHLWKFQEYAGCFNSCRKLSFMATACRSCSVSVAASAQPGGQQGARPEVPLPREGSGVFPQTCSCAEVRKLLLKVSSNCRT